MPLFHSLSRRARDVATVFAFSATPKFDAVRCGVLCDATTLSALCESSVFALQVFIEFIMCLSFPKLSDSLFILFSSRFVCIRNICILPRYLCIVCLLRWAKVRLLLMLLLLLLLMRNRETLNWFFFRAFHPENGLIHANRGKFVWSWNLFTQSEFVMQYDSWFGI